MNTFSPLRLKLIYVFRINDAQHSDCLKVGETTFSDCADPLKLTPCCEALNHVARQRIDSYTRTAGIAYELLHTELALFVRSGHLATFNDGEVHNILLRSGIKRKRFGTAARANEWFCTDLQTVQQAIAAAKAGRSSLSAEQVSTKKSPIIFRPEQRAAIDRARKHLKRHASFLWNAKMRFGKTLSALQLVKESGYQHTLILTHRPVVNSGWYKDFTNIFADAPQYAYGAKDKGYSFAELVKAEQPFVYFASLQDLRGSKAVGGEYDKNAALLSYPWDLLIIDEAHEGTQTERGNAVIEKLCSPTTKCLFLSGTPFNLIDNFKDDEIFTWDYPMEQEAKLQWQEQRPDEPNPYAPLPRLQLYTYDLGEELTAFRDAEREFNFKELFRTDAEGHFLHDADIDRLLHLLAESGSDSGYPFTTPALRENLRHTLWTLPGVAAAHALCRKLRAHRVFGHYHIVDVAGSASDSDLEEGEVRDALQRVDEAIGSHPEATYSITLTCGRLTTGVSVPAWTAVLMLSGGAVSGAMSYMQTLFRVQTPATIGGRSKQVCYAFDFAPDRALRIFAETARYTARARKAGGNTSESDDREALRHTLRFCPIIALRGSQMQQIDERELFSQLKRVYVEHVVRSGFDDARLYNIHLSELTPDVLKAFQSLQRIVGRTAAQPRTDPIDINAQGFTGKDEEGALLPPKRSRSEEALTPAERLRLEQLRAQQRNRQTAISILRGISIRMPLILYGAEIENEAADLTLDNFTSLVDARSWREFMPRGITKAHFEQFKRYYDADIFAAAGKRIRTYVRQADRLSVEERIAAIAHLLNTFQNPDKETVLTPWRVVNMHLGKTLGGYNFYDERYARPVEVPRYIDRDEYTRRGLSAHSRVLDLNAKTGLYPLYAAYTIFRRRKDAAAREGVPATPEGDQRLWNETLRENIFALCKTPMAQSITRRTLRGFRLEVQTHAAYCRPKGNQRLSDEFPQVSALQEESPWRANTKRTMKFDAIIGNPPYQIKQEHTSDTPVYHLFMDAAFRAADLVTLVTPARFLFGAGKTPKEWNDRIRRDPHLCVTYYTPRSADVFPAVDIKGGVAITLRDAQRDLGGVTDFSAYPALTTLARRVAARGEKGLDEIIYPQHRFALPALYADHPALRQCIGSDGHEQRLTTAIFSLTEVFADRPDTPPEAMRILGLQGGKRCTRVIARGYLQPHPLDGRWKVLVPKSNGSGAIGEVLSTPVIGEPVIGEPVIGYTQSFIAIGSFATRGEAEAALRYVRTRFARCLLGMLKATQDNSAATWRRVPQQDFTPQGDIDWTASVADIDQQLFAKYALTPEERTFILTHIKPMD